MNAHYENVFDSIFQVVHDKKDKTIITTILCGGGKGAEVVPFANPIKAVGNIEEWLGAICKEQQGTVKEANTKQLHVLQELSSWCLKDLGSKPNRKKIETLVTIHVHQRDIAVEMLQLYKSKKISDALDFEWQKQ